MNKLIFALCSLFLILIKAHAFNTNTLCTPAEKIVVSCPLKGNSKKIISICSRVFDKNDSLSYIEYKFGTKKKLELTYKATKFSNEKIYRGIYEGTYSVFFGFKKINYFYLIEMPQERLGAHMNLSVTKDKQNIVHLTCKSNDWIENKNIENKIFIEMEGRELINENIK